MLIVHTITDCILFFQINVNKKEKKDLDWENAAYYSQL